MGAFWRKDRQSWEYEFKWRKKRYRRSGFPTKRAALEGENAARELLKSGRSPLTSPTFRNLALGYLRNLKIYHTETWEKISRWVINRHLVTLFDIPADSIAPEDIQKILTSLKGQRKAATLNHIRATAKAIFNHGIKKHLIAVNPAAEVPPFPEDDQQRQIPTENEFQKVLEAANPQEKAHLLFLKHTMCRIGSSLNVKRTDVNLHERWVDITTRKRRGGAERRYRVPINSELFEVLSEQLKTNHSDYLFPAPNGQQRRRHPRFLRDLCKAAKVRTFTFHAIRHYSATHVAHKKAPLRSIQQMLGHTQITTTSIYVQSLDKSVIDTAELLATPKKPVDNGGDFGGDF